MQTLSEISGFLTEDSAGQPTVNVRAYPLSTFAPGSAHDGKTREACRVC